MSYRPTADERAKLKSLLRARFEDLTPRLKSRDQYLGRRSVVGCVALEITQRCNLDCTLCYLSEFSEAVPDIPLEVVKARLDKVKEVYGVHTNVQITGGDPTLRDRKELVEIVRYAARIGLFPALFTNGIRASRDLLSELADVGLIDVAFHVDLTQERKGFKTEQELNAVREKYLERAGGLGLAIIFNTTVHDANVREVPMLARWFRDHAGPLGMASFQLQADTGRGWLRERDESLISKERIQRLIQEGVGTSLSWDAVLIGHPDCHNVAYTLSTEGLTVDLLDDKTIAADWMNDFGEVELDRSQPVVTAYRMVKSAFTQKPEWIGRSGRWLTRKAVDFGPAFARALVDGRPAGKLSFFIHNFQDASKLDEERLHNCSFHCVTDEGGLSMCAYNARRDELIIPERMKKHGNFLPKRPPIGEVDRATANDAAALAVL
ncbi:MAG: radical SAM protein [Deltaproteobacteria bacterium]|nr:radical SAM protein [Deltaproteobacteria bacterium]